MSGIAHRTEDDCHTGITTGVVQAPENTLAVTAAEIPEELDIRPDTRFPNQDLLQAADASLPRPDFLLVSKLEALNTNYPILHVFSQEALNDFRSLTKMHPFRWFTMFINSPLATNVNRLAGQLVHNYVEFCLRENSDVNKLEWLAVKEIFIFGESVDPQPLVEIGMMERIETESGVQYIPTTNLLELLKERLSQYPTADLQEVIRSSKFKVS